MPTDCFPSASLSEGIDSLIPTLDKLAEGRWVLIVQRSMSAAFCISGFLLNLLLLGIILRCRTDLLKMRQVVLTTCVLDTFTSAGFGHIFLIANSFLPLGSRSWEYVISGVCTTMMLINWTIMPAIFLFRMHLVKYGEQPRGRRLLLYLSIAGGLAASFWVCSVPTIYSNDQKFADQAIKILRFNGYEVPQVRVFGASMVDLDTKVVSVGFPVLLALSYGIVIRCSLQIRQFLRTRTISKKALNLNAQMDRLLLLNAVYPLLFSILPAAYLSWAMSFCTNYPLIELFCSTCAHAVLVAYPVSTIFFVAPYRAEFLRLMGCNRRKRVGSLALDTSTRGGVDRVRVFSTATAY